MNTLDEVDTVDTFDTVDNFDTVDTRNHQQYGIIKKKKKTKKNRSIDMYVQIHP